MPRPSSLCGAMLPKPTMLVILLCKKRPTRSQVSAPWKERMAISKLEYAFFFAPIVVIVAQHGLESMQDYFYFVFSELGVSFCEIYGVNYVRFGYWWIEFDNVEVTTIKYIENKWKLIQRIYSRLFYRIYTCFSKFFKTAHKVVKHMLIITKSMH